GMADLNGLFALMGAIHKSKVTDSKAKSFTVRHLQINLDHWILTVSNIHHHLSIYFVTPFRALAPTRFKHYSFFSQPLVDVCQCHREYRAIKGEAAAQTDGR